MYLCGKREIHFLKRSLHTFNNRNPASWCLSTSEFNHVASNPLPKPPQTRSTSKAISSNRASDLIERAIESLAIQSNHPLTHWGLFVLPCAASVHLCQSSTERSLGRSIELLACSVESLGHSIESLAIRSNKGFAFDRTYRTHHKKSTIRNSL